MRVCVSSESLDNRLKYDFHVAFGVLRKIIIDDSLFKADIYFVSLEHCLHELLD